MIWTFIAGMFVGAIFGATIMSLCVMAGRSQVDPEVWRRIERLDREVER